jgi:hypothetical protein
MTPRSTRLAVVILILINVGSASALTHLLFFAGKGARYTALDGAQERQERITSDLALAARIDLLHNLLEESCGNGL